MRTLLRLVLAVLGLLLAVVGTTAAVIVGSDDTVFNKPATIDPGGRPIATVPGLFSYDNLEVTARASSPEGVFIATAHPVDLDDYLGQRAFYEIEQITRTGIVGDSLEVSADREAVEVAAAKATFWTDVEQGDGTRSLALDAGSRTNRVVVAALGDGPVDISFGATIEGLFTAAVAVAVVGVLILLLALFASLRARRRRHTSASEVAVGARPTASVPLARIAALALVVPLAGCGSIPEHVAYEKPAKVALTEAELPAMLADYDQRNNAAIKAARGPRFDAGQWHLADVGPVLETDLFSTFEASVLKEKRRNSLSDLTGEGVYSGQFDAYPMWAIVQAESSAPGTQSKKERRADELNVELSLFTRESAASDWLKAVEAEAVRAKLPETATDASVVTGRALEVVRKAIGQQRRFIETGRGTWPADKATKEVRKQLVSAQKNGGANYRLITDSLSDETHGLFAVEVEGGVLALATYAVRFHIRTTAERITWAAPYDQIRASVSDQELVIPHLATTAIYVTDDGKATPLGTTHREISSTSSDSP